MCLCCASLWTAARFLHRVGKYTGPNYEQVFPSLVLEVEALIAQEAGDYVGKLDRGKPTDPTVEMSKSFDAARKLRAQLLLQRQNIDSESVLRLHFVGRAILKGLVLACLTRRASRQG